MQPAVIFILALLFRLGAVFAMGHGDVPADGAVYVAQAEGIAQGRGFLYFIHEEWTNLWVTEPGYSFFLAFWMILGIPAGAGMLVVQAVLGAILAPVIYSYADRRSGPKMAAASALLYALDPIAAAPCLFILRELFVMALIMAGVCAMDIAGKIGSAIKGFLMGFASLSFPVFGLWPIWAWVLERRTAANLRKMTMLGVLVAFGVSGLWMVRNAWLSGGNFVFRRHTTAVLLYQTARYDFHWLPDPSDPEFKEISAEVESRFGGAHYTHDQKAVEAAFLRATARLFLDDPLTVAFRFVKANFWFWVEVPGAMGMMKSKPIIHGAFLIFHLLQLALFFAGLALMIRRSETHSYRAVWGTVAYLALLIIPFMPIPRYYLAILPLMDIIAAYGLLHAMEWLVARRR